MSEQDEIDARRERVVMDWLEGVLKLNPAHTALALARAIRLSDEAAGYVTAKLETLESAKERRG